MIKTDNIFDDFSNMSGLWIDDTGCDDCDLAQMSDFIVNNNISCVSVAGGITEKIWSWVEDRKVRIFNRFFADFNSGIDNTVSGMSRSINDSFRHGATGAQVILKVSELAKFVDAIYPIKSDLFFNHDFVVGLNVDDVASSNWTYVFDNLNRVKADAVLLTAFGDKFDASSDFVGRIYAMFEHWNFDGELHVMFGKNMMRLSQVLRLARKMQPTVANKMIAFIKC